MHGQQNVTKKKHSTAHAQSSVACNIRPQQCSDTGTNIIHQYNRKSQARGACSGYYDFEYGNADRTHSLPSVPSGRQETVTGATTSSELTTPRHFPDWREGWQNYVTFILADSICYTQIFARFYPYISVYQKVKTKHSPGNISLALITQPPVLYWTVQLPHVVTYWILQQDIT